MTFSNWKSGEAGEREGGRHVGTGTHTVPACASGIAPQEFVVTLRLP